MPAKPKITTAATADRAPTQTAGQLTCQWCHFSYWTSLRVSSREEVAFTVRACAVAMVCSPRLLRAGPTRTRAQLAVSIPFTSTQTACRAGLVGMSSASRHLGRRAALGHRLDDDRTRRPATVGEEA